MAEESTEEIRRGFDEAVNMTPKELEEWLATEESQSVGQDEGGESTGHRSGRRIVEILRKGRDDLTDDDLDHMRKVRGYVAGIWSSGRRATSRTPAGVTRS